MADSLDVSESGCLKPAVSMYDRIGIVAVLDIHSNGSDFNTISVICLFQYFFNGCFGCFSVIRFVWGKNCNEPL